MRSLVLFAQYCAGDPSRRMGLAGHVARMGRTQMHRRFWWVNMTKRDHLEDPGINNIKMDLQEMGSGSMDWIDLARKGTGGGHL